MRERYDMDELEREDILVPHEGRSIIEALQSQLNWHLALYQCTKAYDDLIDLWNVYNCLTVFEKGV